MLHDIIAFTKSALESRLTNYEAIAFEGISEPISTRIKGILNQKVSKGTKRYDDLKQFLDNGITLADAQNLLLQLNSNSATRKFFESKFHESTIPKITRLLNEKIKVLHAGPSDVVIDRDELDRFNERLTTHTEKDVRISTLKIIGKASGFTIYKSDASTYIIEFDALLTPDLAMRKLFVNGIQPDGIQLIQDRNPKKWVLRLNLDGLNLTRTHSIISNLSPELYSVLFVSKRANRLPSILLNGILSSSDTPEESKERYEATMNFIIPFLGISVREALRKYQDGWYHKNGYTFYVGYDTAYSRDRMIHAIKESDYYLSDFLVNVVGIQRDAYLKNIQQFLETGLNMREAKEETAKQWQKMNQTIAASFANALTSAPGSVVRPNPSIFKKLDYNTLIELGSTAFDTYQTAKGILDPQSFDDQEITIDSLSISQKYPHIAQLLGKSKVTNADLGKFGETMVSDILQRRGFVVYNLQNRSGQGVDRFGVKEIVVNGEVVRRNIIPVEIKTSITGNFKLSPDQKDMRSFVKSRLKTSLSYSNLSPSERNFQTSLLNDIEMNKIDFTTGLIVFVTLGTEPGTIRIRNKLWKPIMDISNHPYRRVR